MNNLSDQTYKMAFRRWWYGSFLSQEKDLQVTPFLAPEVKAFQSGDWWLRGAREASLISLDQAAKKMGVSRANFHALEAREETGRITIESLAKAAGAIDCELVYAIRPKKRERFSFLIWKKLVKEARGALLGAISTRANASPCFGQNCIRLFRRSTIPKAAGMDRASSAGFSI
jgi:transcriptional regulator with XRE-family HTH domain